MDRTEGRRGEGDEKEDGPEDERHIITKQA